MVRVYPRFATGRNYLAASTATPAGLRCIMPCQFVVAARAKPSYGSLQSTAEEQAGTTGETNMRPSKWLTALSGIVLAIAFGGQASAQQTIKVAYTDPLSGPFAQVGDANLKQMQ